MSPERQRLIRMLFDEYIEMYMHAGWDTKIQALVDRRMALADGSKEIHAVFDTLRQLGTGFGFTRWGYGMGRPWGNMSQWYGQARWDALFEAPEPAEWPRHTRGSLMMAARMAGPIAPMPDTPLPDEE